jgi:hypothetical protein
LGKIATVASEVDELERKRGVLAEAIDELPKAPQQDRKKRADALRKSCLLSIEELLRRLEALDSLSVGGEEGARAARKDLVNRYHSQHPVQGIVLHALVCACVRS